MVHDKWSLQRGQDSNPQPFGHVSSPLPLDRGILPSLITYCYHLVTFISLGLAQSDRIKQCLLLYKVRTLDPD
jgi:hypothetical protein